MSNVPVDKFGRAFASAFSRNFGPKLDGELISNALLARSELLNSLIDPKRDIDTECHYPTTQDVAPEQYKQLYDRDPIANRIVQCLPKECWQVQPSVYESEDPEVQTPFEEAWDSLQPTTGGVSWYKPEAAGSVWEYLERIDILSGIGHFGVLLMGFDDGKNLQEPVNGAMVLNDCYLTEVEECNLRETLNNTKYPLNNQEEVVLNQLARQREFVVNTMQQIQTRRDRPQQNPVFGQTDEHDPNSMTGVQGTDKQYSQEFGLREEAAYSPGLSGTDQQYFGVQFGPSEQPVKQPSKRRLKLLFLRPFDESLVQIVRYEWNINNPRFGMPVMYRITLNDPREMHSGIGLPMATVFVHWSRVIHVNDTHDTAGSSEIFSPPRMRPCLNRLLDLQKIYGASAEGYWQAAFTGLSLETHPQLGGDVTIDGADVRDQIENYVNSLQRYLALTGMSAHTLAPQVSDPSSQIDKHLEAICIQKAIPKRVFMGSERGELASSQDDASWNDRLRARQQGYVTPRIIVPFIDRLIAVGVLPEPNYVESIEEDSDVALDYEADPESFGEELAGDTEIPNEEFSGGDEEENQSDQEDNRTPASLTKNVFCPTGEGGGQDPSCSPLAHGTSPSAGKKILKEGIKLSKSQFGGHTEKGPTIYATRNLSIAKMFGANKATNGKYAVVYLKQGTAPEDGDVFYRDIAPNEIDQVEIYKIGDDVGNTSSHKLIKTLTRNQGHDWLVVVPVGDLPDEDEEDCNPASLTGNAFCPTGEGGGVDPSCSYGNGSSLSADSRGGVHRVDKFSNLKAGKYGRGAFIMPDNSLIDVTADFGGGTNDHVGVFQMTEHPEEFGISRSLAVKAAKDMEEGEFETSMKMWDKAYNKGVIRVRQHEGQVNSVGLDFNPNKNSPSKIASHIEEGRIPIADEYVIEADTRGKQPGFYGTASLKELQTAGTWEQLAKRKEASKGSLVKQFHTNRQFRPILNADGQQVGVKTATGYSVLWPDLDSNTDKDKAQIAVTKTQALATYVAGNVESVMPLMDFLTKIMGLSDEEAKPLVQAAEQQQAEMELQQAEQQAAQAGQLGISPDGLPIPGMEQPNVGQGAEADFNDEQGVS